MCTVGLSCFSSPGREFGVAEVALGTVGFDFCVAEALLLLLLEPTPLVSPFKADSPRE